MSGLLKKVIIYPGCSVYKGEVIVRDDDIVASRRKIIKITDDLDGKYIKHGKGELRVERGDRFIYFSGNFEHDKKNGSGTMIYPDSSSYKGNWKDDIPYGEGEIRRGGNVYVGEITAHKDHPKTLMPLPLGKGVMMKNNGDHYEGQFSGFSQISGKRNIYLTGDTFDGTYGYIEDHQLFKEGRLNILNYSDYTGQFKEGIYNGKGEIVFKNGDKYSGNFRDGFFHGTGIFYDSQRKREYRGNWKNGNIQHKHNIRDAIVGRSGISFSESSKINIRELIEDANKSLSSNIYKPGPESLYPGQGVTLEYIDSIQARIQQYQKLKLTLPDLYSDKPAAYFTIRAHGGYSHGDTKSFIRHDINAIEFMIDDHIKDVREQGAELDEQWLSEQRAELEELKEKYSRLKGDNPWEGEYDRFIVPEGIRLVFLDNSLHTLSTDIDKIVFTPDFYKDSLIDRMSYESIAPISIFSTIKNQPYDRVSKIDICKFLNNRVLPSKFVNTYMNWKISNRKNLRNNLEFYRYHTGNPLALIADSLNTCSNSIYDSGMECSNLHLDWNPVAGDPINGQFRVKVGVYPIPNDLLTIEAQNPKTLITSDAVGEKAYKRFTTTKSFEGGFMPCKIREDAESIKDRYDFNIDETDYDKKQVSYITQPDIMWSGYGDKSSQLKDFVKLLPRGTREHPCVYFMISCRGVRNDDSSNNVDPQLGRSLRTHSDTVQGKYDKTYL